MIQTLDLGTVSVVPQSPPHRPEPAARGQAQKPAGYESARGLRALRLDYLRSVRAGLDRRPRVVLYVLVKRIEEAAHRRAEALAHAQREGYEVVDTFVDDTWQTDPGARPALARAHAALRCQAVDGIVAASRVDISPFDRPYEEELRLLKAAGGFLALALDESRL
ncbi:hypothetical protein [Streptomyces sp. MZ04]|uniref:hypothetical protein n=1 Tax=Streptomyces sp. MZ04 TaxID=2559236 RepID=UPI00107E732F|nr:hypothetical protein [Streptomyces sp. MZ04]TGB15539.1 hypothetical protein E2651_02670 [Streptomyces sp. MZ04]